MFQKWQTVTLGSKDSNNHSDVTHHHGVLSPMINKRLTDIVYCDSDEDGCYSPQPPHDVPKGYLAVYVGPQLRRFIIPTSYLSHSLFKALLEKAAEEFGFDQSGGLTIPCEIETFKYLLNCIENHDDSSSKLIMLLYIILCTLSLANEFQLGWISISMFQCLTIINNIDLAKKAFWNAIFLKIILERYRCGFVSLKYLDHPNLLLCFMLI